MNQKDAELRNQWRKELEKWGPENVRIALGNQTHIPNIDRQFAWDWLREQDEKRLGADRQYAKWNLIITVIAAVAGIIAATTGILTLIK